MTGIRNDADLALADLAQIPDDSEMAAQARMMAGQVELRRDRARHAEELIRAAVRLDPRLAKAHSELIFVYGMQLRRVELNAEFLALSKLTQLTPDNVFHWCLLRTASWEPKEMVETLTRYISADPSDRWSRLALAENYRRMGLPTEAESTLSVLPQDDSEAIAIRGPTCALELYEQSRAESASSPLAGARRPGSAGHKLRGRLALVAKNDGQSPRLKYFRIAYAADPDSHETRSFRAVKPR